MAEGEGAAGRHSVTGMKGMITSIDHHTKSTTGTCSVPATIDRVEHEANRSKDSAKSKPPTSQSRPQEAPGQQDAILAQSSKSKAENKLTNEQHGTKPGCEGKQCHPVPGDKRNLSPVECGESSSTALAPTLVNEVAITGQEIPQQPTKKVRLETTDGRAHSECKFST